MYPYTLVQSKSTRKLPKGKRIVMLGENETGKTSLVAKVKGDDDPKKGLSERDSRFLIGQFSWDL